jgi:hypothetical protein
MTLAELVQRGDPDDLVREVDRLCAREAFDVVLQLREHCHAAAHDLGRQLWGPAQYAEYRLALEAPAPIAAGVVTPGAARFALGPLTEVVAQHHRFADLADHLDAVVRPVVAQECALRGEDLDDDPRAGAGDVGLPARLQPWEPIYPVPTYRADEVLEPEPDVRGLGSWTSAAPPGTPVPRHPLAGALADLVAPWRNRGGGATGVAVVEGDLAAAVAAVADGPVEVTELTLPDAFARMAWAGASGGARGRRRGGAAGRVAAWWVGHAATGVAFPADPDELEFHLEELAWYVFDEVAGRSGWQLRLAVAGDGWAAAIRAHDDEDDHA